MDFNSLHFCLCWGAFMGGNYVEITMPVSFADTKYALFSAWNNGTLIDDNINAWRLSVNRFASNRSWNGAHDGGISVYMNYCAMGRIN